MLRGNSPISPASDTPTESLVDAHARMLLPSHESHEGSLAVQAGAGIAFEGSLPTTINGNVCGESVFTGDPVMTGVPGGDYILERGGNAYQDGCGPSTLSNRHTDAMKILAKPINGAIGGQTFEAGTFSAASFTIADTSAVTLRGGPGDIFLFQSGSYMVTGANTEFILQKPNGSIDGVTQWVGVTGDDPAGPQAKNILFVLTAAATTGAESKLPGSILAGAAITHGAGSDVSGYSLASAAMTIGSGCSLNLADIGYGVTSPIQDVIDRALCFNVVNGEFEPCV